MLGNLVAAVARTSKTLIIGRAVTGAGAAGVMTGNMVAITMAAAPTIRPQLMNLSIVMVGIGGAVGPVVGGAITQHIGWRWCTYCRSIAGRRQTDVGRRSLDIPSSCRIHRIHDRNIAYTKHCSKDLRNGDPEQAASKA